MLKIRLFPILILFLGLVVTFFISYSAFKDNEELDRQTFENVCQTYENKIFLQLNSNAQILYNSAAFISSSDTVLREEWNEYQFLNKSFQEVPGIQGIGFAVVVPKKNIRKFEKRIREEGFPNFELYPKTDRDFYTSVLYIEPISNRNLQIMGFDGYTEPIRQKVMADSRDRDLAMISDKLVYASEAGVDNQAENIMYYPVFRHKTNMGNVEERHTALLGWVFTPFRMDDLLLGILEKWDDPNTRLKIYDNGLVIQEKLLFDSDSTFNIKHDTDLLLSHQIPMEFNGKVWLLDFSEYENQARIIPPKIVMIVIQGILASTLLFILAVSLIVARTRAGQIQVLNDELKNANASKDRFIKVLAHDLKSPFNALLGFSELLSENLQELDDDQLEMYVSRVYSSAQVAYLLLDELLMWAKVQSGQFPFSPEKINLYDLAKSLVADQKLVAENKEINISVDQSSDHFVMADVQMLKTILRNLLVNAIKYTNRNGSIKVGLLQHEGKARISVSDTGVGISAEDKKKLFDKSQVFSKDGTASEKGTGLGLMLCKDLVALHHGEIWVDSNPNVGSTFTFTLPLA